MRIYMDTCCLSRLLDVSAQQRVLAESGAVRKILDRVQAGSDTLVGSTVLVREIAARPDEEGRNVLFAHLTLVSSWTLVNRHTIVRARTMESMGFGFLDALHIVCAEEADADVFLTTDDRLYRSAARKAEMLRVPVMNPFDWVRERESP